MITLETATEWLQEYFQINKIIFPHEEITKNYSYWENEICDWYIQSYYLKPTLKVQYDPLFKIKDYSFVIPNTKEEFFTILNILEK